jgi:selT/selW/selH-like putative selenoprotein
MIPSSGGVFEITVDDTLIYSKKVTGEFPPEFNIVEQLQQMLK